MNSTQNLLTIIDNLQASGLEVKVTKLPTRKPRKGELVMDRVGGGKTAYRPSIKMGNGGNRHIKA